jgi:hypothetical protein
VLFEHVVESAAEQIQYFNAAVHAVAPAKEICILSKVRPLQLLSLRLSAVLRVAYFDSTSMLGTTTAWLCDSGTRRALLHKYSAQTQQSDLVPDYTVLHASVVLRHLLVCSVTCSVACLVVAALYIWFSGTNPLA